MKKFSLIIITLFTVFVAYAQTAVNQDGTIKFRGNVAIFVDSKFYTFQNGKAIKSIDDETATLLKTSLRAIAMEKFQNICFGIVNRDNDATRQVEELIKENKLEDYLDGISVKAKNQGADYLYLVEVVIYGENNAAVQLEISTRLMNVENNMGYHSFFRSNALMLNDEVKMRKEVSEIIHNFSLSLEGSLLNLFPEQYFVSQSNGKEWTLGAYQPNGRIMPTDKFYAFDFQKTDLQIGTTSIPIQVLENVATCQNPSAKNGQLIVKSDRQIPNTSNIVLIRNVAQPVFRGTNQMTMTFFGLDNDNDSFDGMIKGRINNAMFDAITKHPGLQLIEHDHLSSLKKERELQKSEDFIDGHVVEQMKSIGAIYLLKLEDYQRSEANVTMKISIISIEQNKILRMVDVTSSIDNIENELYKQLCERIAYPCVVKKIDKDKFELASIISLQNGNNCILELRKEIQNPVTGEVTYNRIDVCSLNFEKYMGNKFVMSVNKVFSADDMTNIEENSISGMVTIRVDGSNIKSNMSKKTDVQQKAEKGDIQQKIEKGEKKQKRKEILA